MRRRRMKALLYRRKSSVSMNSTSRILTGCSMKPSVVYFTPCSFAGSLNTLPKSKKLSREWNLLGRRMSLQQMYSGEWMGMPSAYWPGLSWGTRPTQLGVTASFFGSCLPSFVRLGAVAVAVGIVAPQWRLFIGMTTLSSVISIRKLRFFSSLHEGRLSPGGERLRDEVCIEISRIAGYLFPDPARKCDRLKFILQLNFGGDQAAVFTLELIDFPHQTGVRYPIAGLFNQWPFA